MFKNFLKKKKLDLHDLAPEKLSPTLSSTILNTLGTRSIPSMPGAAQQAFSLATDPNAEARDFIELIESDEALSARVIKIANSVFFDRGKPSQTIEESVVVIGIKELRCLLNASTLSDIFPSKHPIRAQLWSNDVATALIARTIAQRILPSKAEIAFLSGLMHDIGKLILLQRVSDEYEKIVRRVEQEGLDFCKAEEVSFPFDHTQVGQLIGEKWNFTPEVTQSIRFHHSNWEELKSNHSEIVKIVKSADIFAHALGLGHPKTFTKIKNHAAQLSDQALEVLRIPSTEKKDLFAGFLRTFNSEFELYTGSHK